MRNYGIFGIGSRLLANDGKFSYGCLMLDFPKSLADQVKAWGAKNIPNSVIYEGPKDAERSFGREKDQHVTVAFGIEPKTTLKELRLKLKDVILGPVKVKLGKVTKFDNEKAYDVIKIDVDSPELHALHKALEEHVGLPGNTFPEYKPHQTIAYVTPGSCDHLLGATPFEGQEFVLDTFDFSDVEASHEKFKVDDTKSLRAATRRAHAWDKLFAQLDRDLAEMNTTSNLLKAAPAEKRSDLYKYTEMLFAKVLRVSAEIESGVTELQRGASLESWIGDSSERGFLERWGYYGKIQAMRDSLEGTLKNTKNFKTDEGAFSVYDTEKDVRGRGDMFTVHRDPGGYIVRNALVPEDMRRQGLATEMYQKMNQESLAKTGKPLRSTQPRKLSNGETVHELSPDAIALWDSFVAKGLATKMGEKDYAFKANVKASLVGALLEDLAKAAKAAVEADPRFLGYQNDPSKASALGAAQKGFQDARSEEEIRKAWDQAGMKPDFETFKARIKGRAGSPEEPNSEKPMPKNP